MDFNPSINQCTLFDKLKYKTIGFSQKQDKNEQQPFR